MVAGDGINTVYLNLKSTKLVNTGDSFTTNKIALKCETISISTTKNIAAMPLPFSGTITGESTSLALDFGVATKNISLGGIITEQVIHKKFNTEDFDDLTMTRPSLGGYYKCSDDTDKDQTACLAAGETWDFHQDGTITVTMTPEEVAQLIHSSVDSSFVQQHQNFSSLTILIPSRVNRNYQYHTDASPEEETDPDSLPKIPFTYKTRGKGSSDLDASPYQRGNFPEPATATKSDNIAGFVRSFNTNHIPGQPFVEFSLDFEVAYIPFG
tara:strand:+ start:262 stop:1068 length:807 start_codon:yes stop_codon:yes gene_type:complete